MHEYSFTTCINIYFQLWTFVSFLCTSCSVFHMLAIAVDRYLAITQPLAYGQNRTFRKSFIAIGLVWAAAFLMVAPPFLTDWGMYWPEGKEDDIPCTLPQVRHIVRTRTTRYTSDIGPSIISGPIIRNICDNVQLFCSSDHHIGHLH